MEKNSESGQSDQNSNHTQEVSLQESPAQIYCTECKTFFGSALMNFMCSKCFKAKGGVMPTPTANA